MDYPASRLEVLLLVEEDDEETLGALRARSSPSAVQVGRDPSRRTPHQAQGVELRSYDGPGGHRGRLRRRGHARYSAVASSGRRAGRHGPEVACVQAQLSYRNATQNIITRWFTVEYAMWFSSSFPAW